MQVKKGYLLAPILVELIAHSKCRENGDGEERGRERDCEEDALGAGAGTRDHRRASPFPAAGVDAKRRRVEEGRGPERSECGGLRDWMGDAEESRHGYDDASVPRYYIIFTFNFFFSFYLD